MPLYFEHKDDMRVSPVVFLEVEMSKLFCLSPGLRVLERQMQEPPGYRPRGYGICIIEETDWKSRGNYSEIVDCVISRMQLEHLKKRVEEIFGEVDKKLIFRSMKHRTDFYSLLMGKRSKTLQHTPNYAAAVFLLSADEELWDKVSTILTHGQPTSEK